MSKTKPLTIASACAVALLAAAAGRADAQSVRVPNFSPIDDVLQFNNNWPDEIGPNLNIDGFAVPLGDAAAGMCGGMTYTVMDYFRSGMHVPLAYTRPPAGSTLQSYIGNRLMDSLDASTVGRTYWLQSTFWDSDLTGTTHNEWPLIKADLDGGKLSPMLLIELHQDLSPFDLGHNHQVLAYGYDVMGTKDRIYIYDPDRAPDGGTYVDYDPTASPQLTDYAGDHLYAFFRMNYQPKTPPATTTWRNGFEGNDMNAWWTAGTAGVDEGYGLARTGGNDGYANGYSGWNAINTWVPTLPGKVCSVRAFVYGHYALDAYVSAWSWRTGLPINEVHIVGNQLPQYMHWGFDFTADDVWTVFYAGLWGTGVYTDLEVDDALVVCQTW